MFMKEASIFSFGHFIIPYHVVSGGLQGIDVYCLDFVHTCNGYTADLLGFFIISRVFQRMVRKKRK